MADTPDVLKRLEEIDVVYDEVPGISWLLRLTRSLLESQRELMERVGNQECKCPSIAGSCRRCKVLDRAERVRKGEV